MIFNEQPYDFTGCIKKLIMEIEEYYPFTVKIIFFKSLWKYLARVYYVILEKKLSSFEIKDFPKKSLI